MPAGVPHIEHNLGPLAARWKAWPGRDNASALAVHPMHGATAMGQHGLSEETTCASEISGFVRRKCLAQ
ncbi:protein of unknown function (plasmid) [Cupriavidus neocaledonicus]|uniref:Uncharacterized protein n=1 Tax=Cupriavidus neocaledonicus TaxID=1040979 RepID=A0A375HPU7_9BURK|nr:protein of unknown function [Cupriavidus neocaledonicus]